MEILIPAEVGAEILRKSGQHSLLRTHWLRMGASKGYQAFIPFGNGLPTWNASTLRKQLQTLP